MAVHLLSIDEQLDELASRLLDAMLAIRHPFIGTLPLVQGSHQNKEAEKEIRAVLEHIVEIAVTQENSMKNEDGISEFIREVVEMKVPFTSLTPGAITPKELDLIIEYAAQFSTSSRIGEVNLAEIVEVLVAHIRFEQGYPDTAERLLQELIDMIHNDLRIEQGDSDE